MKKIIAKIFFAVFFSFVIFVSVIVFGGISFCIIPGTELSDPPQPTFGCFYSSP